MQLCYRGIPYQPHTLEIPQTATGATATFRGASYPVHQVAIDTPIHSSQTLTYRLVDGQRFTCRFLGRLYQHRPVHFIPTHS